MEIEAETESHHTHVTEIYRGRHTTKRENIHDNSTTGQQGSNKQESLPGGDKTQKRPRERTREGREEE